MSPPVPDPLVVQMRAARNDAGLSLERLSARTHIPAVVIASWERGDRQPPLSKLRPWLRGLQHDLHALPTNGGGSGAGRLEYAVVYGPNRDGLIECGSADEAAAIAAHMPGAEAMCRVVRPGPWQRVTPRG